MARSRHHRNIYNNQQGDATGFGVTTTAPAQTLTISSLGVSEEVIVDWGDGQTDAYTGTAQRTHQYADASDYTISFDKPEAVTTFDLRDNKATLNSADVKAMVNIETFIILTLKAGTFDSADVVDWRPSIFQMLSMPSGYAGTFNSADIVDWRPTTFFVYSMPAGYAGTFDSSDVSAWRPSQFLLRSMPSGYAGTFNIADIVDWRPTTFFLFNMPSGYTFAFADADFNGWTTALNFQMQGNGLTQAKVDTILYSLYVASLSRTATNGTINVGGSNAAPSGTFQAAASCPVDTDTPGKEVAHELLNDTCAEGFNTWATVTFTA